MSARLIDGNALARSIRDDVSRRVAALASRPASAGGPVVPGLAVVLVGDDAASAVYVRNKVKDCAEVGIASTLDRLPADTSEAALLAQRMLELFRGGQPVLDEQVADADLSGGGGGKRRHGHLGVVADRASTRPRT